MILEFTGECPCDSFTPSLTTHIFWSNNLTGTIKFTITRMFADGKLAARFFCLRGLIDVNPTKVVRILFTLPRASQAYLVVVMNAIDLSSHSPVDGARDKSVRDVDPPSVTPDVTWSVPATNRPWLALVNPP